MFPLYTTVCAIWRQIIGGEGGGGGRATRIPTMLQRKELAPGLPEGELPAQDESEDARGLEANQSMLGEGV